MTRTTTDRLFYEVTENGAFVVVLGVGWLVLDEPVRPAAVAGFAVILVGFALQENRELAAELAKYCGAGQ